MTNSPAFTPSANSSAADGPARHSLWNIRTRVAAMAVSAIVCSAALAGVSQITAGDIGKASSAGSDLRKRIGTVTEVRMANMELVLAAMDAIVDKDEGRISTERMKIIDDNVALIRARMDGLKATAALLGMDGQAAELGRDFSVLAAAIQSDLRKAIESKAGEEAFARLDDSIDGAGDRFSETLKALDERGQTKLEASFDGMAASVEQASVVTGAIFFAAMAVLLPLMFFVGRGLVRSIRGLTEAMSELARGERDVRVPYVANGDEIGAMARAVEFFRQSLVENDRLQESQRAAELKALEDDQRREMERLQAQNDVEEQRRAASERAEQERKQSMLRLADEFERSVIGIVSSVVSATDQMRGSAEKVSSSAERATQQTTSVAASAEEATANVQTVAAATDELEASIQEINRQVTHSNKIAQNAVAEAEHANAKVEGLAESAQKIGDVIGLITDIASQTNLLALNATIEAARAGEAGKGFAVVATEVKSLADQTARATEEIGAQISAIQDATTEAVRAIQGIGTTITEIGEIATTVVSAVSEQGSATREIAGSVQQAAAGTQDVSQTIAQITRVAEENRATSSEMLDAANSLARQGATLREEVKRFLDSVRAA